MSTGKRQSRVAFRSKPVSRQSTQPKHRDAKSWTPTGPFRLLNLPSELRVDVLEIASRYAQRHHRIINLLLVCQQLFHEVASIYYKNTIIDLTQAPSSVEQLGQVLSSTEKSTLSLWRHVHLLVIKLHLVDHLYLLPGIFSPALQSMTQAWMLRHLRIQIESKFPSDDFFGTTTADDNDSADGDGDGNGEGEGEATYPYRTTNGISDLWKYHHLITGSTKRSKGSEPEVYAPLFVSTQPFQDFLRFLYLCKVPDLSLYVDAHDHHPFWCMAHKDTPRVKETSSSLCSAQNSSKSHVEIDNKELIRTFGGARLP